MPGFQETQATPSWPGHALELKHTDRDVKATTTGKNRQVTVFFYKIFTTVFTVTSKIKTLFSNQTHQFKGYDTGEKQMGHWLIDAISNI